MTPLIPLRKSEKGQAIVVVAVMIIVLLGLTALAIDGGMVYSERRSAQNATDAAALAGALEKANNRSLSQINKTIETSLGSNGIDINNASAQVSGLVEDYTGQYYLVTVTLTDTVQTYFAQVFMGDTLTTKVSSIVKVRLSQPFMPGTAIISMKNCAADGDFNLKANGGGNSGGVQTRFGGMFVNSMESPGDVCAIEPPNNGYGIQALDGEQILSVGSFDYSSYDPDELSPLPVVTGLNAGVPINDPYPNYPEPQCTEVGHISGSTYSPGRYGGPGEPDMGWGNYLPGIYCIHGDVNPPGNGNITGSGVVFFFIDGRLNITGNSGMDISAPEAVPCTVGGPTDPCTYNNMAIFAARSNTSEFRLTGNGVTMIRGLVYALNASFVANGGGNTDDEYHITGQLVCASVLGNGNGTFKVYYDAGSTVNLPVQLSLVK